MSHNDTKSTNIVSRHILSSQLEEIRRKKKKPADSRIKTFPHLELLAAPDVLASGAVLGNRGRWIRVPDRILTN